MKTFPNGWVMVEGKPLDGDEKVQTIVAMSPHPDALHKFVVAHYAPDDEEWFWGTYHRDLRRAVTDYLGR